MINNSIRDDNMGTGNQNAVESNGNWNSGYRRDVQTSVGNDKMTPEMLAFLERRRYRTAAAVAGAYKIRNNPEIVLKRYPTGSNLLDKALGGGITEGITILQAMSSSGKTTFALQMATAMAEKEYPVMYVTTEMTKNALVAKMISRASFGQSNLSDLEAVTVSQLTSEAYHANASNDEWERVVEAARRVGRYGDRIEFLDNSDGSHWDIDRVAEEVELYIKTIGTKPVVIFDYLQILPVPGNMNFGTDKQIIDYTIRKARELSNKHRIPIILISSVNRSSYKKMLGMGSGNGSGEIEYSADVLLGLQYEGFGNDNFNEEEAKKAVPRRMELVIIKQRNGSIGDRIPFSFYAKYNDFLETPSENADKKEQKSSIGIRNNRSGFTRRRA